MAQCPSHPAGALEVVCLGQGQAPCTLLRYRHVHVLLDCGLSLHSGLHLTPPTTTSSGAQGLHLPSPHQAAPLLGPLLQVARLYPIHAVLVSTPEALLALPLLMQQHPEARTWTVLCTLAALDIARHLAAELCDPPRRLGATTPLPQQPPHPPPQHQESNPQSVTSGGCTTAVPLAPAPGSGHQSSWGLPSPEAVGWQPGSQGQQAYEACWGRRFTAAEAAECFSRVKAVRYGEHVSLDDMYLSAVAYPSGSGTGHALWIISDGSHRIGYLSRLSLQPNHSLAMEPGTLGGLSALILAPGAVQGAQQHQPGNGRPLTAGAQIPSVPHPAAPPTPSGLGSGFLDVDGACREVVATLAAGGCALIPVTASGAVWPLLEALAEQLQQAGMEGRPLVYVGPAARDSLALACTSPEFLSRSKQAQVQQACSPFPFDALLAAGRLRVAASLADPGLQAAWREPAVVLAHLASWEAGAVKQLLLKWGADPRNLLLLGCEAPCGQAGAAEAAVAALAQHLPRHAAGAGASAMHIRIRACNLAPPAPPADQLARLLAAARPSRLLLWDGDLAPLQALPPQAKQAMAGRLVPYSWLQLSAVQLLPAPSLPPCSLTTAAAAQLRWQPLERQQPQQQQQQQEALVTRFRGTLTLHDKDHWELSPSQPVSAARAAASGALGPPGVWRRPQVAQLVQRLREQGHYWLDVRTEKHQAQGPQQQQQQQQQEVVVVLRLPEVDGSITLGATWASVCCNDAAARRALYSCISGAAQVLEAG